MTLVEIKTVKEQLVEAREALELLAKEEQYLLENLALEERFTFEKAKEMAELTKLSRIYDMADSIKRSKSTLKHFEKELKRVAKEIKALEKELAKLVNMDVDFDTDVVDEFLSKWRANVEVFVREGIATKFPEALRELEASEEYQTAKWSDKNDMVSSLRGSFGSIFTYCWDWRGELESKMKDLLDKDVVMKKAVLLGRITELTGKVTEAELRVAGDGNINGYVTGEKGSAKVQTILAGGYNIQCLHYRLLVTAM